MVLKIGFRFFMRDIIPFSYDFKVKYDLIQEEKAIDQKGGICITLKSSLNANYHPFSHSPLHAPKRSSSAWLSATFIQTAPLCIKTTHVGATAGFSSCFNLPLPTAASIMLVSSLPFQIKSKPLLSCRNNEHCISKYKPLHASNMYTFSSNVQISLRHWLITNRKKHDSLKNTTHIFSFHFTLGFDAVLWCSTERALIRFTPRLSPRVSVTHLPSSLPQHSLFLLPRRTLGNEVLQKATREHFPPFTTGNRMYFLHLSWLICISS